MNYIIDNQYMIDLMQDILNTPSPVGFCDEVLAKLEEYAKDLGYSMTYDNKTTGYIRVEGQDRSKCVAVSAHVDTLGMMVKKINDDGSMKMVSLGGVSYNSLEGETVTVHTREGKSYSGLVCCKYHSVHVFDEARTAERNEENMILMLDEVVHSKEDVLALGIMSGDIISINPRFEYTKSGYIKSRFIDDKACVATIFGMLKALKDNNLKPQYDMLLIFPQYEEIGHGGAYVPEEVSEYLAVDIGLVGPDLSGDEFSVSICAKDAHGPYDRKVTNRLVNQAKTLNCDFHVDVFYRYGTDGGAANRGGNNLAAAAMGPGTICTHGMERTHIKAIENTTKLLIGYALNL